jgi:hypothetical protein
MRSGGWTSDGLYHRVSADVNGDGMADIVGFGAAGTYVSLATGGAGHFGAAFLGIVGFATEAGGWDPQSAPPRGCERRRPGPILWPSATLADIQKEIAYEMPRWDRLPVRTR